MKAKKFPFPIWIVTVALFFLLTLLALITKVNSGNFLKQFMAKPTRKILNYAIENPRAPITVNLFEAERYEPAIIVQSLIGNLVYYSNLGRYEPRLAKKWIRSSPTTWEFELHDNLVAENGEKIDASSFKESIERSLRTLSREYPVPILSELKGYQGFMKSGTELTGIQASDLKLTFEFNKPIRDGLLQILSFAPFGFISSENLNSDGTWKDEKKFVSSGPYRLAKIVIGEEYILVRRVDWALPFSSNAPEEIRFVINVPDSISSDETWILDTFTRPIVPPKNFHHFPLVPEYLNAILLGGNGEDAYFANITNRKILKRLVQLQIDHLPKFDGPHVLGTDFYPSQTFSKEPSGDELKVALPKSKAPLRIEGVEPSAGSTAFVAWKVLKPVLDQAGLTYEFENNSTSQESLSNRSFDIRLRGASIGGGAEAWGLKMLFCSEIGPKFPDPGGEVCAVIDQFEDSKIDQEEFARKFSDLVDRQSAVLTVSHYGVHLYLSPQINQKSFKPTLSIIRFDQLEID